MIQLWLFIFSRLLFLLKILLASVNCTKQLHYYIYNMHITYFDWIYHIYINHSLSSLFLFNIFWWASLCYFHTYKYFHNFHSLTHHPLLSPSSHHGIPPQKKYMAVSLLQSYHFGRKGLDSAYYCFIYKTI
jgi:hypothetical protein